MKRKRHPKVLKLLHSVDRSLYGKLICTASSDIKFTHNSHLIISKRIDPTKRITLANFFYPIDQSMQRYFTGSNLLLSHAAVLPLVLYIQISEHGL